MSVSTTAISSKPLFGGKQSQRNQYVKDAVLTSQDISRHDFFWLVQRRSMAWRGVLKGTPATAMFQDKRWQQPTSFSAILFSNWGCGRNSPTMMYIYNMTASKGFTHSLSSLVSEGHNSHKSVEKLALAQPYANFGETRMQLFRKAF